VYIEEEFLKLLDKAGGNRQLNRLRMLAGEKPKIIKN